MTRTPTQQDRLLEQLRVNGAAGITPLEALEHLGIYRLAAVVFDLRADGHDIVTHPHRTRNGATVARYELRQPARQLGLSL